MTAKRALVVDDSRSARISLQKLLQKYGIGVDFAESGEEALDYLKHHVADAIFMDHTMPGMDGLETVVAIKSNPRTATIPVMMYTANEGEVYVGQARALGALGVLPKQVQPGVLEGMLERLGLLQPLAEPLSAQPAAPAIFAGGVPGSPPAGALDQTTAAVDTRTGVQAARVPESAPSSQPDPSEQGGAEQAVATPSPVLQQAVAPAPHMEHSGISGRAAIARAEAELEAQALAMTLQAVVERTLAEQHVRLRADILRSHREIGHQVAEEVLAGVEAAQAAADDDSGVASAEQTVIGPAPRRPSVVVWVLLIALSLVAAALWRERVDLVTERDRLAAAVDLRDDEMARLRRPVDGADAAPGNGADGAIPERRVLATLAWALARDNRIGFDEQA
ncbi:MAG: response regulator, partial [Gammaproteobacteria bacterium]